MDLLAAASANEFPRRRRLPLDFHNAGKARSTEPGPNRSLGLPPSAGHPRKIFTETIDGLHPAAVALKSPNGSPRRNFHFPDSSAVLGYCNVERGSTHLSMLRKVKAL